MADLNANTVAATSVTANTFTGNVVQARVVLAYGTTVDLDASVANVFSLTVTDGVAFAISAPTNATTGKEIIITIKNTSGGAVGTITWNAIFKKAAFTTPATANQRSISFVYDGTNWIELYKTAADVGN